MTWDPAQYLTFGGHRIRPAIDLLSAVPMEAPKTILDLGCGTGNITEFMQARWPEAKIVGLDNSADMLAKAQDAHPDITWIEAEIGNWSPEAPFDLVYSNAVLHWVPDHGALFPDILKWVTPNGYVAIQMPRNFQARSHTTVYETIRNGDWRTRLEPMIRDEPTSPPTFYYDLLKPLAQSLDLWETEYQQILEGENPVPEYVKGTWLKPFLDALEEPEKSAFEADYKKNVL
ncbi:MAG: methyltransferase domain-containing protein, partial [Pseudomonadota bacterium]|nr:methyltransferase domain-containing protein [Pseudomonadota bacterium]